MTPFRGCRQAHFSGTINTLRKLCQVGGSGIRLRPVSVEKVIGNQNVVLLSLKTLTYVVTFGKKI